jgi:hypothetical protein
MTHQEAQMVESSQPEPCPHGVDGHTWHLVAGDSDTVVLYLEPAEPCTTGECLDQLGLDGIVPGGPLAALRFRRARADGGAWAPALVHARAGA